MKNFFFLTIYLVGFTGIARSQASESTLLYGEVHNSVLRFLHQNYSPGKLSQENLHEALNGAISLIRTNHSLDNEPNSEEIAAVITMMEMPEMGSYPNYLQWLITNHAGNAGLSENLIQLFSSLVDMWNTGATEMELDGFINAQATTEWPDSDQQIFELFSQIWTASKSYWGEHGPAHEVNPQSERKWVPYLADAIAGAITFELGPGAAICAGFASWFWDEVDSHY